MPTKHEQYVNRNSLNLTSRLKYRYSHLKSNARQRGISFTLTLEQFINLWKTQKGRCAYTGQRILLSTCGKGLQTRSKWGMSVDRLDSTQGYSASNCVMVRHQVNNLKQRKNFFSPEFMETFPDYVSNCLALYPHLNFAHGGHLSGVIAA